MLSFLQKTTALAQASVTLYPTHGTTHTAAGPVT